LTFFNYFQPLTRDGFGIFSKNKKLILELLKDQYDMNTISTASFPCP